MMSFTNKNFSQIKFKLPLFWKFSIAIIFIVIVFGSINSILIYNNVQSVLQSETEKRALFIANSISHQVVSFLLFDDYITLQNIINGIKEIDQNIEYVFIVDSKGNIVVHTFQINFPYPLLNANNLADSQKFKTQLINIKDKNEELILDVAVPILDGQIGNVRVGLKESIIKSDVQKTVNVFWIMVGIFLFFGIIGALIFANFITKPIKTIQNVADKINLSQIGKQQLPQIRIREKFLDRITMLLRTEDEIDILADRFNQMIRRLENAYRELQKAQLYLLQSEKLATVGTLTAGLAHEINNPIAGIQNCIRRIKVDPANIKQNRKYLELMENATNKVEMVVTNLLNFSRKPASDYSEVSLNQIIENSLLLVGYRLEKHRLKVTNNLQKNLPSIEGNRNELEQVFVNLFMNAIDAIEDNCKNKSECERRLVINSSVRNSEIEIEVIDSGSGIPSEHLDRIFDPFFTTKEVGRGTGLGLTIVYNIVTAHKGTVKILSDVGKETKVILSFPVKKF